ncbi:MAG TPA: tetratricopeptide repeat protein [Pirellulales bacterium]|jgi:tetratricopeptide (TPR) repeat protein|nr:tetratricopeptide repeat protein [Pirellulales bacterium]
MVIVVLTVFTASILSPTSLMTGVAFERGQRAEQQGDYATAVSEYKKVLERFPDSTVATARLGIAYAEAGNDAEAMQQLGKLGGRKTSPKLAEEVHYAMDQIYTRIETNARRSKPAADSDSGDSR